MSQINHIVILTGAGISAESGINTFRAEDGLWENHPVEQVATPQGFAADPVLVHKFYNERRAQLKTVAPNPAHFALARLQKGLEAKGGSLTLVTQNVDNLHARGGARGTIHMHGSLTSALCAACGARWEWHEDLSTAQKCGTCAARAVRPDIVWFGEMPYHMEAIERAICGCDLFVSIGTSGAVYPAAGYVKMARELGIRALELNLEPSQGSHYFDETRHGKAGTIVPEWVEQVLI